MFVLYYYHDYYYTIKKNPLYSSGDDELTSGEGSDH